MCLYSSFNYQSDSRMFWKEPEAWERLEMLEPKHPKMTIIFFVHTLLQDSAYRTLKGHSHSVEAVAFSPDGRLVASGSDGKTAMPLGLRGATHARGPLKLSRLLACT